MLLQNGQKSQLIKDMFYKLTEINVINFFKNIQHRVGHWFILVSINILPRSQEAIYQNIKGNPVGITCL